MRQWFLESTLFSIPGVKNFEKSETLILYALLNILGIEKSCSIHIFSSDIISMETANQS